MEFRIGALRMKRFLIFLSVLHSTLITGFFKRITRIITQFRIIRNCIIIFLQGSGHATIRNAGFARA